MDELFYLKYKPKSYEELDFCKEYYDPKFNDEIFNTLIYGNSGIGKLTRANILIKNYFGEEPTTKKVEITIKSKNYKSYALPYLISKFHILIDIKDIELNQKIILNDFFKDYVLTSNVSSQNYKIVILKNSQLLTQQTQHMLRRLIEKYQDNCRFIFLSNSLTKIISPIRSRLILTKVCIPNEDIILSILNKIIKSENIEITKTSLKKIIEHSKIFDKNNIKYLIKLLQFSTICKKFILYQNNNEKNLQKIIKLYKLKDISQFIDKLRTILYDLLTVSYNFSNGYLIIINLLKKIYENKISKIIDSAKNFELISIQSNKPIVHFEAFLINTFNIINNN